MMRMTILALSLAMVAVPASAANESESKGSAESKAAKAAKAEEIKYCLQFDDIVGSRIRGKQECKTKAEWAREGVEVTRPSKG